MLSWALAFTCRVILGKLCPHMVSSSGQWEFGHVVMHPSQNGYLRNDCPLPRDWSHMALLPWQRRAFQSSPVATAMESLSCWVG